MLDVADKEKGQRERESVGEVVNCGSDTGVDEVAEHEQVGGEEEDGEEKPAVVEVLVGEDGDEEEGEFFDVEEERGTGEHGGLYEILGR